MIPFAQETTMKYKYLFGPVRSRRLGMSLGIDMVQFKTCSLDCIYCECGATTQHTLERREYAPVNEIIAELNDYLSQNPEIDYVTFGGSGEPTLHSGLGQLVGYLKSHYPSKKVALLTNSTLFSSVQVRSEVLQCDLILPSLDAVSDEVFEKVNKPVSHINCKDMIDGLTALSKEFKGQIWLEVFIVPGINDTPEEIQRFKEAITQINPTRVQLNSLDRPGTCSWLKPASAEQLSSIAGQLMPLPVEIISRNLPLSPAGIYSNKEETLLSLLKRRPSTVEDVAVTTGTTINESQKLLEAALKKVHVVEKLVEGRKYYCIE